MQTHLFERYAWTSITGTKRFKTAIPRPLVRSFKGRALRQKILAGCAYKMRRPTGTVLSLTRSSFSRKRNRLELCPRQKSSTDFKAHANGRIARCQKLLLRAVETYKTPSAHIRSVTINGSVWAKIGDAPFRELFQYAPVAYHKIDVTSSVRRVNQTEYRLPGLPQALRASAETCAPGWRRRLARNG